ncbi:MAG: hypothetical protein HY678_00195 [Chloroflexi bacterium]|nr:hypothetical protein [Chloroflexota bacterium]
MHCPAEKLADLAEILDQIRRLPQVSEVKPGIFYMRRVAFLHFHLTNGHRSADVRCGDRWGPPIPVPFDAGALLKAEFIREVSHRHAETIARLPRKRHSDVGHG